MRTTRIPAGGVEEPRYPPGSEVRVWRGGLLAGYAFVRGRRRIQPDVIVRRRTRTRPPLSCHHPATNRNDMRGLAQGVPTMIVAAGDWTAETPELLTAERWDSVGRTWLYLVAEATPDGSWD